MLEALGLRGGSPTLWPIPAARAEALAVLQNLGWDPGRTLALLVDHAAIAEDPMIVAALASVAAEGWTVLGIGGRSSYGSMEQLLAPFEDRAVNLAGVLSLGSMAALLPLCGAFLGGTAFLRSVAEACGCAPLE